MRNPYFLLVFLLPCFLSCQQEQEQALLKLNSKAIAGTGTASTTSANIIFQSKDGGQNWQDISTGLPLGFEPWNFLADKGELILTTEKGVYKTNTASKAAQWEKDVAMDQQLTHISASPGGVIATSDPNRIFQRLNGTDIWMPIFPDFKEKYVSGVFTAKDGSIFIGAEARWGHGQGGIIKSTDQGKTWKHVMDNGWVNKMVELDGVLLCTSQQGILRSTDGGENWEVVLSEGGVGIDVTPIKGGFAAIDYAHGDEIRHVQISTDSGKTWNRIDAGLPPSKLISSIVQVGDTFYCGHPKGIYRSDDQGKTWELTVPTIGEKVFNLSVSDGVMYAVLRVGGC